MADFANSNPISNGFHHNKADNGEANGVVNASSSNDLKTVGSQSRLVPTASKHHVPKVFHEPHVEQGFRVLGQPWSYYICSVFQLHNESVNIWSHMLAFLLTGCKLAKFGLEVDLMNDNYAWPLLAGLGSGMALYLCSSAAHCLQSRSELAHYVAFTFDYAGIGLYGLGSVIMHLEYCCEDEFYNVVQPFFIPAGCFLAVSICFCCSLSKMRYERPYPFTRKLWQITPVAGIYAVLISPIVHRLITCFVYNVDCTASIWYHVTQMMWFAISAFFFSAEFPQSLLAPGSCDHFFHGHQAKIPFEWFMYQIMRWVYASNILLSSRVCSHFVTSKFHTSQIFHFSIMMSTLYQAEGVFIDFKIRRESIMRRAPPSFSSAFGPVIGVCFVELIIIYVFYVYTQWKLNDKSKGQENGSNEKPNNRVKFE